MYVDQVEVGADDYVAVDASGQQISLVVSRTVLDLDMSALDGLISMLQRARSAACGR